MTQHQTDQTKDSSARTRFAERVRRMELETGARLLVLENRATPTVAIKGSLRAGSYFEPREKPGVAQIAAEMLDRGTRRRNKLELARDIEATGAQIGFGADAFAVRFGGRALAEDLPEIFRAIAEILREPAFPQDELDKLKQQTVAALLEQHSNTGYRAYERFAQLLFAPEHPFYVQPLDELTDSINRITTDDLHDFYRQQYGGRSLIISLAGDVEAQTAQDLFDKSFAGFSGPERIEIEVDHMNRQTETVRETVRIKGKPNIDVLLGSFADLRRDSEDYYAAIIANSALGQSTLSSRLGLTVRDREGLTYGINSRFRAAGLVAGAWYIGVSLNPSTVERAIESTLNVVRDYIANGITDVELADEKSSAIGTFKVALSTNGGLADAVWNAEFYDLGADYVDRFPAIIERVTGDEVNRAIRRYFNPDQLTIVAAGDYEPEKNTV